MEVLCTHDIIWTLKLIESSGTIYMTPVKMRLELCAKITSKVKGIGAQN